MKFKSVTILFIMYLMIVDMGEGRAQTNDNSISINSYSFDLYREMKVEKTNLFLSPLSTYYSLLMAYEGSKNKTNQEFEKVLYLKNSGSLQNDYLHNLPNETAICAGINVSNAIWLDKSFQAEEGFRECVTEKYFSDLKRTDFTNTQLAVSDINGWVSDKTNQRIKEIINSSNINHDTKLLISNAIYFKGEWLTRFEKQKTIPAPFFTSVENQYQVDFMKMTENLQYFENDGFQFISKPYRDSDLSFCIILPKKLFGIEEIEERMNNDFLYKYITFYSKNKSGG